VLPVQNAETAKALTGALGLKGQIKLDLDEVMVPVTVVEDLTRSNPYSSREPFSFIRAAPAVALRNAAVTIEPGAGDDRIVVIKRINITPLSGVNGDYRVLILTPALIAAANTSFSGQAIDFNSPFLAGAIKESSPLGRAIDNATVVGTLIDRVFVLTGTTAFIEFPLGLALYGDDSSGPIALAVFDGTVNQSLAVTFLGTLFRAKG